MTKNAWQLGVVKGFDLGQDTSLEDVNILTSMEKVIGVSLLPIMYADINSFIRDVLNSTLVTDYNKLLTSCSIAINSLQINSTKPCALSDNAYLRSERVLRHISNSVPGQVEILGHDLCNDKYGLRVISDLYRHNNMPTYVDITIYLYFKDWDTVSDYMRLRIEPVLKHLLEKFGKKLSGKVRRY